MKYIIVITVAGHFFLKPTIIITVFITCISELVMVKKLGHSLLNFFNIASILNVILWPNSLVLLGTSSQGWMPRFLSQFWFRLWLDKGLCRHMASLSLNEFIGPLGWQVNIGSGYGLVPAGSKPMLHEPMLSEIYVTIWHHYAIMCYFNIPFDPLTLICWTSLSSTLDALRKFALFRGLFM